MSKGRFINWQQFSKPSDDSNVFSQEIKACQLHNEMPASALSSSIRWSFKRVNSCCLAAPNSTRWKNLTRMLKWIIKLYVAWVLLPGQGGSCSYPRRKKRWYLTVTTDYIECIYLCIFHLLYGIQASCFVIVLLSRADVEKTTKGLRVVERLKQRSIHPKDSLPKKKSANCKVPKASKFIKSILMNFIALSTV